MIFVAKKIVGKKKFSPSFGAVVRFGYGTDKNQDPGSSDVILRFENVG
jgi:hypothetical protein